MGKTAQRLREIHPSRDSEAGMVHSVAVEHLLRWHLGPDSARVHPDDVGRLMVAMALATAEQARRDAGHESRKDSLASLRAMHRLPDDELVAALQTCDMATCGRIQTAHAELYYANHGIPSFEIFDPNVSDDDLIALLNSDDPDRHLCAVVALGTPLDAGLSEADRIAALECGDAFIRATDTLNGPVTDAAEAEAGLFHRQALDLPAAGQPLHLPMGIDGLRDAIANAITIAEQEAGSAGNKSKPHMDELAWACEVFMRKHPPAPNWPGLDKAPPSPAVSFTTDVFKLAGMDRIGDSRIERLLTAARKSLDWRPKSPK